jgi:hypothetical protein
MNENKLHHLAICRSAVDGRYYVSNHLYSDPEFAKRELGLVYHRLWTEGPSVVLEVVAKEEQLSKAEKARREDLKNQSEMNFSESSETAVPRSEREC